MTMYNFDALSDENVSEEQYISEERWKRTLTIHYQYRHVIHFEAIGEPSNSRTISICMRDDDHFVASSHQAL